MKSKSISELRQILATERQRIPACNLIKFDAEASDFIANVLTSPERYNNHAAHMWRRIKILSSVDASHTPPMLIEIDGETPERHLERCYDAGGYYTT